MSKTTRRESRETAFALLFEWSFQEEPLKDIIEAAEAARDVTIDAFALELAEKAIQNRGEMDSLIEKYSQGWKLKRISHTVLSALRMSFCEMTKFEGIPAGASINEAVELVKKFGTDEEAAYVNGILGRFERVRRGLLAEPPGPVEENLFQEDIKTIPLNEQQIQNEQDEHNEHGGNSDEIELIEDIVIEVE